MALTVSQIVAVSYPAVLARKRRPANQWSESALLKKLEKIGAIEHKSLGSQIEVGLDYRRNPGTAFLATDLQATSLTKTEVVTGAVYDIAEVSVPVVWSKKDEVMNPSENQKYSLAATRMENGIDSHDDIVEQSLFATSTQGFLGLLTHIPTSGQGSDGGIDSAVETFWRCQSATYVDDTDIEAAFNTVWNACAKGSGSELQPGLLISDGATQAIFEGTQTGLQRYENTQDIKAGAKTLMYKTASYCFSQYGTSSVYFLNAKNFKLVVSKEYFRDKGETQELQNANGFVFKIYSAMQTVVDNRSRLGVVHI